MLQSAEQRAKITFLSCMLLFSSVGIFVHFIPLPSTLIAAMRGVLGTSFLLLLSLIRRRPPSLRAIRKNLPWLCLSGAFMGINWILIFEAYRHTTMVTAILCYYMAPIFIILASPFLLKERLTLRRAFCALCALIGMVFVSGMSRAELPSLSDAKGILLALSAAVFYAGVILINLKFKDISVYDKTIFQLGVCAILLVPYTVLTHQAKELLHMDATATVLLLTLGIVHTGMGFATYFTSLKNLRAHTVALFSYIDPVLAIFLSALILHETIYLDSIIGAVLILGSALFSELSSNPKES